MEKEFKDNPFLNLNDAVYRLLYQNIINLTLKPGSALSETSLAKELDLSRTPIRNALMQLQKNGLVSRNKGQSFSPPNLYIDVQPIFYHRKRKYVNNFSNICSKILNITPKQAQTY